MSAYDAVKAKYGYREISIATWRDPRQSVHPARGGPRVMPFVSPESASQPFTPYKVKYRPRPAPDDEESEDENVESELSEEAPIDSPQQSFVAPEERSQEANTAQDLSAPSPDIAEPGESDVKPEPVAVDPPSDHVEEASTSADAVLDDPVTSPPTSDEPPAADPPSLDELPPVAEDVVETAEAVAEASSPGARSTPVPEEASAPLPETVHEDDLNDSTDVNLESFIDESAPHGPPGDEPQTNEIAGDEEHVIAGESQEEPTQSDLEASPIEVITPVPESPNQPDDAASIEEIGEKKVQFAPGTPEPKPTQRKKKPGKSSKSKKGRKPLPFADDQGSPDEIVAIVEGPFDETSPPSSKLEDLVVIVLVPDEEEKDVGIGGSADAVGPDAIQQQEIQVDELPPEPISAKEQVAAPPVIEPAKKGKSSKNKGKEKSKSKSSKTRGTVVEAPSIDTGLGIDFGSETNGKPAAVESDAVIVKEIPDAIEDAAEVPAPLGEEMQMAAKDASLELETAEAVVESDKVEAAVDSESMPGIGLKQTPSLAKALEPAKPAESTDTVSEVGDPKDPTHDNVIVEANAEIAVDPIKPPKGSDEDDSKPVPDSLADSEETLATTEEREGDPHEDNPESPDDKNISSVPDSAITHDEKSPSSDDANEIKAGSEDDHAENDADDHESIGGRLQHPENVAETEQLDEPESPAQGPDADAEGQTDSPVVEINSNEIQAGESLPNNGHHESEDPAQEVSEDGTPRLNEAIEETPVKAAVHERAPSIEQLSNATEVGDESESEDANLGLSMTGDGDGPVVSDVVAGSTETPAVAADIPNDLAINVIEKVAHESESATPDVDDAPPESAVELTQGVAEDSAKIEKDGIVEMPGAAEDVTVEPSKVEDDAAIDPGSLADAPAVEMVTKVQSHTLDDTKDPVKEDTSASELENKLPIDLLAPAQDMSETLTSTRETDAITLQPAPGDAAKETTIADPGQDEEILPAAESVNEPSVNQDLATVPEADLQPGEPGQDHIGEKSPAGQDDVNTVDDELVNTDAPVAEVVEAMPMAEPEPELETVVVAPAIQTVEKEVLRPDSPAGLAAEQANEEPTPSPPELVEEQSIPTVKPPTDLADPLVIPASSSPALSDPPSPKLSRSSGSRSKGERYQVRPSKRHFQDPSKKKTSKDQHERTPEEIAERQRRKDARRLAESSRRLEEERRRFEEEEMRRMRHEVRRAARKAAAAEVERLAREEAEAAARREMEKRRKRRESDRPRERRVSGARPWERGESKSSGGLWGLGSGKSEPKPGLFARTDSGGSSRPKSSKHSDDGRTRRVLLPREDNLDQGAPQDEPKSTSHDGSSKRRRRHRSETDRAEPRRRETGERRYGERGDGERKRSSKPEKPKGFFGSLFAKF